MALNVSTGTLGDASPALGAFPANHAYYVREFLEIALPELVYDMFGTPANVPSNESNTIAFNKVAKLATLESSPLTEGVTPTEQQFQLSRITQAIAQYGGFATCTDRLTDESINGLTSEFNKRIGEQAGQTMNKVDRDNLVGGSNVRYYNGVANRNLITSAGVLHDDFDYMFKALKLEKVKPIRPMTTGSTNINTYPTRETYPVIIPVEAATLVETLDDGHGNPGSKFIPVEAYGSQRPTWTNEYGTYKQFSFVLDTEGITVTNTASPAQTIAKSLVFGKGAYRTVTLGKGNIEIIIKPLGSGGTSDPLDQRSTIGWKAKKGAVIVQPTWMFRYEFSLGAA